MGIKFERRKHKRFKYEAIISHDIMSLEIIYSGRVHNFSNGGLYFESDQTLYQGEEIYIWTGNNPNLADSDTQILIAVEIMWHKDAPGSAFKYGYGAKLTNANDAFGKFIDKISTSVDKSYNKKSKKRHEMVGTFLKEHGITWTPAVFIYIFLLTFFVYKIGEFPSAISSPRPMPDFTTSQITTVRGKVSYQKFEPSEQSDIEELTERKFTIYFRRNSNELSYEAHQTLILITRFINQNPESKIVIEGFTDSLGKPDRNKSLSKIRANGVKDFLVSIGVDHNNITAIGRGSQKFLADNETKKGRRLNRRVEITVGPKNGRTSNAQR